MRSESESMPGAVEVKDGTALVRANITSITRADDGGKSRTVYQYDEVRVATDGAVSAADLVGSAEALVDAANVSDSGSMAMPKGADRMVIPHRLGVAPESISAVPRSTINGLKVFVSSDSIILVAGSKLASPITVDWSATGKGRTIVDTMSKTPLKIDVKAVQAISASYAAKAIAEDVLSEEMIKG